MIKHESKAALEFIPNNIGRIELTLSIQKANKINMEDIDFALDTGSDFTTIGIKHLIQLGYTKELLQNCPYHKNLATTVATEHSIDLQYIDNVTVLIDCIELKNRRIYFSMDKNVKNLLGSDLLKYFNMEINRDIGLVFLTLTKEISKQIEHGKKSDICYLND